MSFVICHLLILWIGKSAGGPVGAHGIVVVLLEDEAVDFVGFVLLVDEGLDEGIDGFAAGLGVGGGVGAGLVVRAVWI